MYKYVSLRENGAMIKDSHNRGRTLQNHIAKHWKTPGRRSSAREILGRRHTNCEKQKLTNPFHCMRLPMNPRALRRLPDVFQRFAGWFCHAAVALQRPRGRGAQSRGNLIVAACTRARARARTRACAHARARAQAHANARWRFMQNTSTASMQ